MIQFTTLAMLLPVAASAPTTGSAPKPAEVLKTATVVWQFAEPRDTAGRNELGLVGNVKIGQRLEGAELQASLAGGDDGRVAEFDGGYLDAGQGTDGMLNVAGAALTVSVRLRSPAATWELPLFSKHGGHERLVYNLYSLGSEIGFELGTEGAAGLARTTVPVAKIGATRWHSILCRYDGQALEMFVDGVVMDTSPASGSLRTGNSEPCLIGAESVGGRIKTGWKGQIDHVAIWKRALSNAEIEGLNGGAEQIAARKTEYLKEPPVLPPPADLYRERLRPQFHVTARQWTVRKLNPGMREEGWINDVNGLIHHGGQYHLFAQRWARCWLHLVSPDLVHWTELPPAFWDDKRFGTGVQSGSIVFDRENVSRLSTDPRHPPLVAFWSGFDNRSQCIAYSEDDGLTWTKYARNPYMLHPERDPKVFWHEPSGRWIMLMYGEGQYHFLNSTDLLNWTDLRNPIPNCFECPDFFPLPVDGDLKRMKWVLMRGDGQYSIGKFDGRQFAAEVGPLSVDGGANFYATQSWGDIPDQPGRRVQIAWMRGGQYPDMPFNQQLSFPCDLTLHSTAEGLRIFRWPVEEISRLYGRKHTWRDQTMEPGTHPLDGVSGDLFDIRLQVAVDEAGEFGLRYGPATVEYSAPKRVLKSLGREAPLASVDGRIDLRILIDRTSVEVFGNAGQVSMSSCFLPRPEPARLEWYSAGGRPRVVTMTVHELNAAFAMPRTEVEPTSASRPE